MIVDCHIYIIGKGFVKASEVSPGDRVYTLKGLQPEIDTVESVTSEYIYKNVNVIQTGIQYSEATDDARYLYLSETHGYEYLPFNKIESYTPNKEYIADKYLPVLSTPFYQGYRSCSNSELEYLARSLSLGWIGCDRNEFIEISHRMTGEDAFVFVDLFEHWASDHPGLGKFGKLNRKSRAFFLSDKLLADEISRVAMLAGLCTMVSEHDRGAVLQIFLDGIPVPGDVPKTMKYRKKEYRGNVFNINCKNRPIFGRIERRAYYLPCTSTINV